MLFEGQTIKVEAQDGGIAELRFDGSNEPISRLDALEFDELSRALDAIKATSESGHEPGHSAGYAMRSSHAQKPPPNSRALVV
jgi:hypothetical protein